MMTMTEPTTTTTPPEDPHGSALRYRAAGETTALPEAPPHTADECAALLDEARRSAGAVESLTEQREHLRALVETLTEERDTARRFLVDTRADRDACRAAHVRDLATVSEALNREADERDYCSEYDAVMSSLSERLTFPLTPRTRSYDVTLSVRIRVEDLTTADEARDAAADYVTEALDTSLARPVVVEGCEVTE